MFIRPFKSRMEFLVFSSAWLAPMCPVWEMSSELPSYPGSVESEMCLARLFLNLLKVGAAEPCSDAHPAQLLDKFSWGLA